MGINRRGMIAGAAAAGAIALPARAQPASGEVRWRLASSFPKSLPILFSAAENLARRVDQLTGGRFKIQIFAAGEVVGGLQVLDAVGAGTVEAGHSASFYYTGKNKAFSFDTGLPFGLNSRQHIAWMTQGGGLELLRPLFARHGVVQFPLGNTGCQMGGWFRKEIGSVADLRGLKMRIPGVAGEILSKLGVVPQTIAAGDIYPALERGTIDAVEWVGPADDERLGFQTVARYFYAAGWWVCGPQISLYVNDKAWAALPDEFKAAVETASAESTMQMLAQYDTQNMAALRRIVGAGAQLRHFPRDVMEASFKASEEYYREESERNLEFKRIYEPWTRFRDDIQQWFRVAELQYDVFAHTQKR